MRLLLAAVMTLSISAQDAKPQFPSFQENGVKEIVFTLPIPTSYTMPKEVMNLIAMLLCLRPDSLVMRDEYKYIYEDKNRMVSWICRNIEAVQVFDAPNPEALNAYATRTGDMSQYNAVAAQRKLRAFMLKFIEPVQAWGAAK